MGYCIECKWVLANTIDDDVECNHPSNIVQSATYPGKERDKPCDIKNKNGKCKYYKFNKKYVPEGYST